jgi:hypothetical protein
MQEVFSDSPVIGPPMPSFQCAYEPEPSQQDSERAEQQNIQQIDAGVLHFIHHERGAPEWRTGAPKLGKSGRRAFPLLTVIRMKPVD